LKADGHSLRSYIWGIDFTTGGFYLGFAFQFDGFGFVDDVELDLVG